MEGTTPQTCSALLSLKLIEQKSYESTTSTHLNLNEDIAPKSVWKCNNDTGISGWRVILPPLWCGRISQSLRILHLEILAETVWVNSAFWIQIWSEPGIRNQFFELSEQKLVERKKTLVRIKLNRLSLCNMNRSSSSRDVGVSTAVFLHLRRYWSSSSQTAIPELYQTIHKSCPFTQAP